jgi:chromosome segregation ATPase
MWYDRAQELEAECARLRAELAAANARIAEGEREFQRYIRELDKCTERAEAAEAREIVLRELLLKILNDYSAALMPEDIANIDALL